MRLASVDTSSTYDLLRLAHGAMPWRTGDKVGHRKTLHVALYTYYSRYYILSRIMVEGSLKFYSMGLFNNITVML